MSKMDQATFSMFQELVVAEKDTVFSLESSNGVSILRNVTETSGSASIPQEPQDGEIQMTTGTTASSVAVLETAQRGRYTPGKAAEAGIAIRFPNGVPTGDEEVKWGPFDDDDGAYFGVDSTGLFVARKRNGTEENRVYKANWNGQNFSQIVGQDIDLSVGFIFQITYTWYGYGPIAFEIIPIDKSWDPDTQGFRQTRVLVHSESIDGQTSITDPDMPIRVESTNGSDTTDLEVRVGGRQYSILGSRDERKRFVTGRAPTQSNISGWNFLASMRRKTGERSRGLKLDSVTVITDDYTEFGVFLDPSISSTSYAAPENVPASETSTEVSQTGSFDNAQPIYKVWNVITDQSKKDTTDRVRGIDLNIPREQAIVLGARPLNGTSPTVAGALTLVEDW